MPTLTTFDGTWVNNPTDDPDLYLDAGELRRADATLFASGGVARGLGVTVSAADEVTVQPGAAVIDGDSVAAGTGVYRAGLPAVATGPLDARDATYDRVDLVVLRQFDPDVVPAHTTRKQAVEVITGTPAAVPSAPALPSLAVELARITVPVNGGAAASVDPSSRASVTLIDTDVSAWTTYTPAWTGSASNPSLGNGAIAAAFQSSGKTLRARGKVTMGSTTTYGSGHWRFSLPSGFNVSKDQVGSAFVSDFSAGGSGYRSATCLISGTTLIIYPGSVGAVNPTNPFTWAVDDKLWWNVSIEVD